MSKVKTLWISASVILGLAFVALRDTVLGLLGLKKKADPLPEAPAPAVAEVEAAVEAVEAKVEERAEEVAEKEEAIDVQAEEVKSADPVVAGNEIVARRRRRKSADVLVAPAPARRTRKARKS